MTREKLAHIALRIRDVANVLIRDGDNRTINNQKCVVFTESIRDLGESLSKETNKLAMLAINGFEDTPGSNKGL